MSAHYLDGFFCGAHVGDLETSERVFVGLTLDIGLGLGWVCLGPWEMMGSRRSRGVRSVCQSFWPWFVFAVVFGGELR